jgi:hypothetical protein
MRKLHKTNFSMQQKHSIKADSRSGSQMLSFITRMFITVFWKPWQWMDPNFNRQIQSNINLPCIPKLPTFPKSSYVCMFHLSHACYKPSSSSHLWCNYQIIFGEKYKIWIFNYAIFFSHKYGGIISSTRLYNQEHQHLTPLSSTYKVQFEISSS